PPAAPPGVPRVSPGALWGAGAAQFSVTIDKGVCTVEEGIAAAPDVTITATAADYLSVVTGAVPFGWAYINGRLKVTGDLRLVLRLATYFAPQSPSAAQSPSAE
ncbi:MAG: SCP2 sterol-binding domain-containing protein, partial [Candidatus Binatia bacterium]|nr:SCP2 sterol-binding domain-containing protein [Candidatus Binatia bacterium]